MQKLPEHKGVQVPSTEQLLEDGSVGKAQYSMQLPFPKCCLCKGLTLQSFRYCWIKKIESILRTSDLWQKLRCGIGKSFWVHQKMCGSRKCPYSLPPHRRDGKFLGWRGGSQRSKLLGNVWSVHVIGIFRSMEGGGGLRINPFHGEGMDNLWNYAIWNFGHYFHCRYNTCHSINAPNIWIFFFNAKIETKQWSQHELNIAQ